MGAAARRQTLEKLEKVAFATFSTRERPGANRAFFIKSKEGTTVKEYLEKISSFGSGERAHQRVREIASFHRIQCSTGLRQAAHHCQQVLESQGICARVIS